MSATTGELNVGGAVVKITAGMTAADIAQAAAKALSQQYAGDAINATKFVKAEAVGEQVKVYFGSNATLLTSTVTGSTTFLSTKDLPATVITAQSITGNTAAAAAVDGKATLDFAGVNVTTASPANSQIKVNIGTTETLVSVAPGMGGLGIAQAVQQALNGKSVTIGAETLAVTATLIDEKVNLTLKGGAQDVTITGSVTVANTAAPTAAALSGNALPTALAITEYTKAVVTVPGTRAVNFDFDGMQVTEAGSITIAGVSIALAKGDDDRAIAKKVHDALNTKVVDNATIASTHTVEQTTVSLSISPIGASTTPISAVAISNITAGFANTSATPGVSFSQPFVENLNTKLLNGWDSTAESDNVVNVGAGNDVLVLGTGANSNEIIKLAGYGNGKNTIVNFSATGSSIDYLDLSDYVGATRAKVALGDAANASGTLAANAVASFQVSGADFARLTDAELLAQLNGTATTNVITGMAAVNATAGGTAVSNYVLMVHNQANPGEYKVFHLNAAAAANQGKFASAQTVATLDFGAAAVIATTPVNAVATLNAAGVLNLPTVSSTDVIKGLAINVADIGGLGAGNIMLSNAVVNSINNLNLDQLTFRFTDTTAPKDTLKLAFGQTLKVANLTVWDGTLDVTAGTLNVSGTITLNSVLKITVDQALALVAAGTKVKSTSTTASTLEVVVNTAAEAAKLDAATVTKLKALLDTSTGAVAVTGSGTSAASAADGALFETVAVADIGTLTSYNLSDTAANLAAAASLNNAVNITATDAATVAEATTIKAATNSGKETYSVAVTFANLATAANLAVIVGKAGIAGATQLVATDLNNEVVTFNNLTAASAATAVDFVDNAATLSVVQLNGITAAAPSLTLTAADVITVTGVALGELSAVNTALSGNDIVQLAASVGDISAVAHNNVASFDLLAV